MSIIFGKYNIRQERLSNSDLIKMNNELNTWNADDEGLWKNDYVGLGHLMLWNTPESLYEKQPLKSAYSGNIITSDARIDNREELFLKLKITDKSVPDSTLILEAYNKYGKNCVQHLIGDFAFVIWDVHEEELFCARDQMGVKPLFYFYNGNTFIWSSDIKGLKIFPEISLELEKDAVFQVLCNPLTDFNQIRLKDIKLLPAGTYQVVSKKEFSFKKYWDLPINGRIYKKNISFNEHIDFFSSIVNRAIQDRCRSAFPIASHLSGGLDSSYISAVAKDMVEKRGLKYHTMGFILPEKYHKMIDPFIDDRELMTSLTSFAGISKHHFLDLGRNSYLEKIKHIRALFNSPTVFETLEMTNRSCEIAQPLGVRTIIDGLLGDSCISDKQNGFKERAIRFYWKSLYNEININSKTPLLSTAYFIARNALATGVAPFRAIAPINTAFLNKEYLRSNRLDVPPFRKKMGENNIQKSQYRRLHTFKIRLLQDTVISSNWKIEMRNPFSDIRVLEYFMNLPLDFYYKNGVNRRSFREISKGIIPENIRTAKKSGIYSMPQVIASYKEGINETIDYFKIKQSSYQEYFNFKEIILFLDNAKKSTNISSYMAPTTKLILLLEHLEELKKNNYLSQDTINI